MKFLCLHWLLFTATVAPPTPKSTTTVCDDNEVPVKGQCTNPNETRKTGDLCEEPSCYIKDKSECKLISDHCFCNQGFKRLTRNGLCGKTCPTNYTTSNSDSSNYGGYHWEFHICSRIFCHQQFHTYRPRFVHVTVNKIIPLPFKLQFIWPLSLTKTKIVYLHQFDMITNASSWVVDVWFMSTWPRLNRKITMTFVTIKGRSKCASG